MVKHKISWRNAGEIPPGFLHEIFQPIMVKNEKCASIPKSTVYHIFTYRKHDGSASPDQTPFF